MLQIAEFIRKYNRCLKLVKRGEMDKHVYFSNFQTSTPEIYQKYNQRSLEVSPLHLINAFAESDLAIADSKARRSKYVWGKHLTSLTIWLQSMIIENLV